MNSVGSGRGAAQQGLASQDEPSCLERLRVGHMGQEKPARLGVQGRSLGRVARSFWAGLGLSGMLASSVKQEIQR